jgi:hypothetical protein
MTARDRKLLLPAAPLIAWLLGIAYAPLFGLAAVPAVQAALVQAALEDWNSRLPAFLFIHDPSWYPYQIALREMATFAHTSLDLVGGLANASTGVLAAAAANGLLPAVGISWFVSARLEELILKEDVMKDPMPPGEDRPIASGVRPHFGELRFCPHSVRSGG